MKIVKVARVGSMVSEVVVQSGATIGQCLEAAGISMRTDEVVYENHMLANLGTNALNGAVIVVEKRKRVPLSGGIIRFIEVLLDEDIIDGEDYEDEECEIDMNELYDDNKEFIDILIAKAKEC